MKVFTKVGDKGQTKFRGEMLEKSNPIFELLGNLDEIQAAIGVAYEMDHVHAIYLLDTMKLLYEIMGNIYLNKLMEDVLDREISTMEFVITKITEEQIEKFNKFVLPIGSKYIASLNYARTVVRRTERFLVKNKNIEIDAILYLSVLRYLNRLSDFLYTLATSLQK